MMNEKMPSVILMPILNQTAMSLRQRQNTYNIGLGCWQAITLKEEMILLFQAKMEIFTVKSSPEMLGGVARKGVPLIW